MKEKLRAGEPVFGVSVMIPSPQIVEMVAAAGFDWVLLDCEHGTLTIESVELMAMAAEASGITAIARPVSRSPEHILQVLDTLIETRERRAPVVTVADAHSHALSFIGSALGGRAIALGVDTFGESGGLRDLYRKMHIDRESIAAAAEAALIELDSYP